MPAKDHAGTQGWRRPRQVARPASRGSFCWFNVIFSTDQRVLVLKRTTDFQEPVTFGGKSLLRYGQLRYAGKQRPLRKSAVETFATLTREERRTSYWSDETQGRLPREVMLAGARK